jgi:hypothetical protein
MKFLGALFGLFILTSCDGLYYATGRVYYNAEVPLDSTRVKIYCGDDRWLRGTTTDSNGTYSMGGLTTPFKTTYYLIFERPGYKTDTIAIKGNKGKTFITLDHIMTRNE